MRSRSPRATATPSASASGSGRARRAASRRSSCARSSALARAEGLGPVPALRDDRARARLDPRALRPRPGRVPERVGMLGPDVVLVHCVRARGGRHRAACAARARASCTARPGPAKMGSGVTPVHAAAQRRHQRLAGHRRRGREQRRRSHARPQVGRLPPEAAPRRSDRDDLRGRVRDGDAAAARGRSASTRSRARSSRASAPT